MIRQTFRIGDIHAVLNHKDVLPHISADGQPLDLTDLLLSGRGKACLVTDNEVVAGCFVFVQIGERAWEIHTNLLPGVRGLRGLQHSQDAVEWAFAHLDAEVLYTQAGTAAVAKYVEYHGFRPIGKAMQRSFPADCTLLRLGINDWIDSELAGKRFLEAGRHFHQIADNIRRESEQDTHPEDPLHDRYAGFVVRMLRHCQLEGAFKAERHYNVWASQARYHPIKLITFARDEIVVDIGDMVLAVDSGGDIWRLR